uniref:G-protein coupled receptors family 1 profile domain-containing protein n=1 Tax=Acrobeloides nanus TaxID=290746 RepID=A0A914CWU2_9BILA
MLIHTICNLVIDLISIISVPLYVLFLGTQLKTILYSATKDTLTPGFTITLLFIGTYDIYYTLVDLSFVELPQWGVAKEWYMQDNQIKGKFVMVSKVMSSPLHVVITLVLAINRYTAVKFPVQYRYVNLL